MCRAVLLAAVLLAACGTVPVGRDPDAAVPEDVDGGIEPPPPQDGFMPGNLQICEDMFQSQVSRFCTFPGDCSLMLHPDCCGDREIAISSVTGTDPATAEAMYDECRSHECGDVGCFHPILADDGQTPGPSDMIVADCQQNQCTSVVVPAMK